VRGRSAEGRGGQRVAETTPFSASPAAEKGSESANPNSCWGSKNHVVNSGEPGQALLVLVAS
jgi:hypothetical protein